MKRHFSPQAAALAWRLLAEAILCALWIRGPDRPAALVLVLFLCVMSLARWRFTLPAWTVILDQAACAAAIPFWPEAAWGLALPVFDATAAERPWFALPVIVALVAWQAWSLPLVAALCVALAAGVTVMLWDRTQTRLRREADDDRREKYELAELKDGLAVAAVQAARTAELSERARIARDLHDHLGHELTAAGLALRAFGQLWREGDPEAADLLAQAERRIENGIAVLRATVSGIAPGCEVGVGGLEEICKTLSDTPPQLVVHGNAALVPAHAWAVLEPCLKEGLTNAVRHGAAGGVSVALDIGPRIVRLCVQNEARAQGGEAQPRRGTPGLGLRSLRQRARAVGGSVTADSTNGFRLICVLPLSGGGTTA